MDKYELNNSVEADLDRTITWQYDNAVRLIASIGILKDFAAQSTAAYWDGWKDKVVDINTADDFGLSIWGKILNCPRPTLTGGTLSTEVYRRILKARFRLLNSNGSMWAYSKYVNEAFSGNVQVSDGLDMSLTFTAKDDNTLTDEELELITNFKDVAFVYPSGVKDNFECDDPVIGFNGQEDDEAITVETLDNGTFHWDSRNSDSEGKKNINRAIVTGVAASYNVTGSQIRPEITVTYDGSELTEDKDYIVQYGANLNKGNGYVSVLGIGDYTGSVLKTFIIVGVDISDATITNLYDSYEQFAKPNPTVSIDGRILANGTDYEITMTGFDKVGNGVVTIRGIGNYDGRVTRLVDVSVRSLSFVCADSEVTISLKKRNGESISISGMSYSFDAGLTWIPFNTTSGTITISPNGNNEVRIRKLNTDPFTVLPESGSPLNVATRFVITGGDVHCYGSLASLMNYNVDDLLQEGSFYALFSNCNILECPDIPFKKASGGCYGFLFSSCEKITEIPNMYDVEFVAITSSTPSVCANMFEGCISLSRVKLNITNDVGFQRAFMNCSSLIEAEIYKYGVNMFNGCSSLERVVIWNSNPTDVLLPNSAKLIQRFTQLPKEPVTFNDTGSGFTFSIRKAIDSEFDSRTQCLVSTDGENWTYYDKNLNSIAIENNGKLHLISNSIFNANIHIENGFVDITGDFLSLLSNLDGVSGELAERTILQGLFMTMNGDSSPNGIRKIESLPSEKLEDAAFSEFVKGSAIVEMPNMPCTNPGEGYYREMFENCRSLKVCKPLLATHITSGTYAFMFLGSSIETSPEIHVSFVDPHEHYNMPAMQSMFENCELLSEIKLMNMTSWYNSEETLDWVNGVSAAGTFYKTHELPDVRGVSNIPQGWEIAYTD